MKTLSLLFLGLIYCTGLSANSRVYEVSTATPISIEELTQKLQTPEIIFIGEKHYTESVQKAEGDLIERVIGSQTSPWSLGWEFLAHTEQQQTNQLWSQVRNNQLIVEDFLVTTQKTPDSVVYAPLLQVVKAYNGKLLGLNLTRAEKSPVVKSGISALDPALLPPDFSLGGSNYRQRFTDVMSGHATPTQIENYFAAQCLTDDVMAYQLLKERVGKTFVVAGSFHTDYFDGTVARVKARHPNVSVATVSIVDASDYTEADLLSVLHDSQYGNLADFVIFVNDPK